MSASEMRPLLNVLSCLQIALAAEADLSEAMAA
jgi:hypothetical protein